MTRKAKQKSAPQSVAHREYPPRVYFYINPQFRRKDLDHYLRHIGTEYLHLGRYQGYTGRSEEEKV